MRVHRRGLLVMFLSTFLELTGAFMLLPLLTITLSARGVAEGTTGLFAAMLWVGVLLVVPMASRLARMLGSRGAFILGGAVPLACTPGFLLTRSLPAWFGLFLASGMAFGLRWVLSESMVAEHAPAAVRGRIIGLFAAMIGATMTIGPALIPLSGTAGALPLLWVIALFGLGCAVSVALPPGHVADQADVSVGMAGIVTALREMPVLAAAGFLGGFFDMGSPGMLSLFGLAIGLGAGAAALLVSAAGIGSMAIVLPMGMLADRCDRRRLRTSCATAALAGSAILAAAVVQPALAWAAAALWGAAGGALYTLAMIEIGMNRRGIALVNGTAVLVLAYNVGSIAAPGLGGWVLQKSGAGGFAGWMLSVAALGLLALWRPR